MEFIMPYNGKSTILASPIVPALTLMGRDLGYVLRLQVNVAPNPHM